MEWVAGLGLNLASAGVWEAIRCAYDLCTRGLLDRQAAAEVLTAAARQVLREGQVGEAHAPAADRFWEAFCRHLLHTLTPDELPAYLFRPDAAACLRRTQAWAKALDTLATVSPNIGPEEAASWLEGWVAAAREQLLSRAAVEEKTFRRSVLRLLAAGQETAVAVQEGLARMEEEVGHLVEVTTHLWRADFRDLTPLSAAEREAHRRSILSGSEPLWADIAAGLDEPRELRDDLWPHLVRVEGPTYIPVVAGPGEGKTTFLKRIAYDLWRAGKPVYLASARGSAGEGIVEGLRSLVRQVSETVWVLVDDMDALEGAAYAACLSALAEARKPCCLVGTMNRGRWVERRLLHSAQINIVLRTGLHTGPYELRLGPGEVRRFVNAVAEAGLYKPGIAPLPPAENDSLLGFLTLLVRGEKLAARVHRQLAELFPAEVPIVRVLAVCHRLGVGLSPDVLERLAPGAEAAIPGLVAKGIVRQTMDWCSLAHTAMALVAMECLFRGDEDLLRTVGELLNKAGPAHATPVLHLLFRFQELWPGLAREVLLRQWGDIRTRFLPAADAHQLGIHWGPLLARAELWPEAEEVFRQSLAREEEAGVLNNYANLLRLTGRADLALAAVRRGLELAPASGPLLANYAWLLLMRPEGIEAALPWVEKALAAADHDGLAHYVHGLISRARGDQREALADFHEAVMHQPLEGDYWVAYGDALVATGDLDGALEVFTLAGRLCLRRAEFAWRQAQVLARQGNYSAASERYAAAAGGLPDEPKVLLEWASVCLQEKHYQPETAWKVCRRIFACREELARRGLEAEAVKTILSAAAGLGVAAILCGEDEESRHILAWALSVVDAAREKLKPQELFEQYGVVYPDNLPPGWRT